MGLPKLDTPIYETTLISTGKKIKFRPFLVKEQKLFLMASQSEEAKEVVNTIKQVLSNCILDDIDINSLPTFDLEHLFVQLRAKSVGEVVNLRYSCNNNVEDKDGGTKVCGGTVKIDLNLSCLLIYIQRTLCRASNEIITIYLAVYIVLILCIIKSSIIN